MSGEGVALRYFSLLQEFSRILSTELIAAAKNGVQDTVAQ